MKVHLIKKQSIEDYAAANPASRLPFAIWLTAIKGADWSKAPDIQKTFGAADLLGNGSDRVIFNIGGNNYRMICKYVFAKKRVRLYICWIGTHASYDRLCQKEQQYFINVY
jgi:mRNA interferase HigB